MVGTPLMVIMGIAIAIIGLSRASKAKRELGLDSERPKHLDW
jgi:hypothetical protein